MPLQPNRLSASHVDAQTDEAVKEYQLLEQMPLEKGFVNVPRDVDDLTYSSGDNNVMPAA